jgi:hypothetical protein
MKRLISPALALLAPFILAPGTASAITPLTAASQDSGESYYNAEYCLPNGARSGVSSGPPSSGTLPPPVALYSPPPVSKAGFGYFPQYQPVQTYQPYSTVKVDSRGYVVKTGPLKAREVKVTFGHHRSRGTGKAKVTRHHH